MANKFVRVRLASIDNLDLNLFDFDYDLTFMVFFLSADERIYARYGGRDAEDAESRLSLAGLRYTMELVLSEHRQAKKTFAPRTNQKPLYVRQLMKFRKSSGCIHCHEAKEMIHEELKQKRLWRREMVWRYPLPENLGITLDPDRGNVVKAVRVDSTAHRAGLAVGDKVQRIRNVPVRSLADVSYALDRAPVKGEIDITWKNNGKTHNGKLHLPIDWRKTDITWRPSIWRLIPRLFIFGEDLTAKEKRVIGLTPKQTAFRQEAPVSAQARSAGIRAGDIIIGVDGKKLELGVREFLDHVRFHYIVGDRISLNVLRDRKRLRLPLLLK